LETTDRFEIGWQDLTAAGSISAFFSSGVIQARLKPYKTELGELYSKDPQILPESVRLLHPVPSWLYHIRGVA